MVNQKFSSKSVQRSNKSLKKNNIYFSGSVYGSFIADKESVQNEDWGFTKFIELEKLMNPNEGFIVTINIMNCFINNKKVNDTIILEIFVANLRYFFFNFFLYFEKVN